jgi:16S rRNA (guanine527-N7)-methyltransferase
MGEPASQWRAFLIRCGLAEARLADLGTLERLYRDLVAANEQMNLTRITQEADFWHLHVADSLSIGLAAPDVLTAPLTVADVGCGAGFPLLVLAWANPAMRIVGFESRRQKANFVVEEIAALGLTNAWAVAARSREAARTADHAGIYDVVCARAVGPVERVWRESRELLKPRPGARLIAYKTPAAIADERLGIERIAGRHHLEVQLSEEILLPGGAGRRQFVTLRRTD